MAVDRPEKDLLRRVWADEVEARGDDGSNYLYLTLPGREAKDIEILRERGILRLTDSGAVSPDCVRAVVAVAPNDDVILELNRRFPGLKIVEQDVNSALSGTGETAWPTRAQRDVWCARVVNLDLDEVLKPESGVDDLRFRVIAWVKKVAVMHAEAGVDGWTLCLTLHGETPWTKKFSGQVQDFLRDNIATSPDFRASARAVLGDALFESIDSTKRVDCARLSAAEQARILLTVVPKAIIAELYSQWDIEVAVNCHYGLTTSGHATMASWVFRLARDTTAAARRQAAYRRQIGRALLTSADLDPTGKMRQLIDSGERS